VARVVAGGRRFSFSVVVVVGDKKGKVGVGTGKASDTALAIEKAVTSAKKNMVLIKRTKEGSIPHEVSAKYSSARVSIMPAKGRGLVAGSSVRSVLDLAGVTNITAKLRSGTKNKLNNAQAAILALSTLATPKEGPVVVLGTEEPKKEDAAENIVAEKGGVQA
jgi:small subunit ribosomal protein S5